MPQTFNFRLCKFTNQLLSSLCHYLIKDRNLFKTEYLGHTSLGYHSTKFQPQVSIPMSAVNWLLNVAISYLLSQLQDGITVENCQSLSS